MNISRESQPSYDQLNRSLKKINSEMDVTPDYKFKIILVGDGTVGKTSIIKRYIDPDPSITLDTVKTVGFEFCKINLKLFDEIPIQVHLWDTAGQEVYNNMLPVYFKKAAGCLCIYDITNKESFEALDLWLQKLKEHGDDQIITMVLGNKQDIEEERAVSESEGAAFARDNNAAFFEVSAQTGHNVGDAIETLINEIASIIPKPSESYKSSTKPSIPGEDKMCCNCCIF
ncbi:unnamed protein product [Moneuplotes crassus]|uniref:Uncharacterized protein n=1 Tax=Euplotes crassus TaxID=5936 RepID=A0AAD1XGP3_EUPCR|nr:unnamed protein product [Moneuplotes crassus]